MINEKLVTSHYLINLEENYLHIAVFNQKDNYFYVNELPQEANKRNYIKHFGGQGIEIYDHFDTERIREIDMQSASNTASVPIELWYFLSQIDTSRYVGCDFNAAQKWKKGVASEDFVYTAVSGIHAMKRLTKALRINFWISSGTLLGWYRQCGLIPYTTDFDFATHAHYALEPGFTDKIFNVLARDPDPLSLFCIYGFPDNCYEITFEKMGTHFDLFFTYDKGNTYTYCGHVVSEATHFDYIYPKTKICSTVLLGEKVLVVCDPLGWVSAEYGPKWQKPVKMWSYDKSAYNMGPQIPWPEGTNGYYWQSEE